MADGTKIEWTGATWNPITGCSVVSPGCTNCYAMRLAGTRLRHHPSRRGLTKDTKAGPVWTGEVRLNEDWLDQPLRWKKSRMIFVCAHGDLFHEDVPDEWIDRVFAVMALAPQHTFQVLTKRADRMRAYLTDPRADRRIHELVCDLTTLGLANVVLIAPGIDECAAPAGRRVYLGEWPLSNAWLGVSAEDQARADQRIPLLLDTPAAVRWVSLEPLLGPVDLTWVQPGRAAGGEIALDVLQRYVARAVTGSAGHWDQRPSELPNLDWVVLGGESGRGARPMHPDWARAVRNQCDAAGVAFFFKQWGEWLPPAQDGAIIDGEQILNASDEFERLGKALAGALLDGREHREFPA